MAIISRQKNMVVNNTKYESYMRISHYATGTFGNYQVNENDWHNCPVPTSMQRRLHDVDVDAYTDLEGFTHRNRKRQDVDDFDLGYAILNDSDEQTLLNLISPEWFYVELIEKKTRQRVIKKMYASDKIWDVYSIEQDENGNWYEVNTDFSVSFVEE